LASIGVPSGTRPDWSHLFVTEFASRGLVAVEEKSIVAGDALILPHPAHPHGSNFRERQVSYSGPQNRPLNEGQQCESASAA
jgi:hypothetical protein